MTLIAILVALVFLHSLVSARQERTVVTAPLLFTAAESGHMLGSADSTTIQAQIHPARDGRND